MEQKKKDTDISYADDNKESVGLLLRLRLPWLVVGLAGGTLASFIMSRFEEVLSKNIALAFFVPVIVYMSDAVGSQTETIFVRNTAKEKVNFFVCMAKESLLGIAFGAIFGLLIYIIAALWIGSAAVAFTVGLAMFVNVAIAPVIALIIPEILFKEHTDPALGAGPFTTIIQDILSIFIYFAVASLIIFG